HLLPAGGAERPAQNAPVVGRRGAAGRRRDPRPGPTRNALAGERGRSRSSWRGDRAPGSWWGGWACIAICVGGHRRTNRCTRPGPRPWFVVAWWFFGGPGG